MSKFRLFQKKNGFIDMKKRGGMIRPRTFGYFFSLYSFNEWINVLVIFDVSASGVSPWPVG